MTDNEKSRTQSPAEWQVEAVGRYIAEKIFGSSWAGLGSDGRVTDRGFPIFNFSRHGGICCQGRQDDLRDVAREILRAASIPAPERTQDPAEWPDKCHPSHVTRVSVDASSYDEICINCGATDMVIGGWGELRKPCSAASIPAPERSKEEVVREITRDVRQKIRTAFRLLLRDLPEIAPPEIAGLLASVQMRDEFLAEGKRLQIEHGTDAVSPRMEQETAAGAWSFMRRGILAALNDAEVALETPPLHKEGEQG